MVEGFPEEFLHYFAVPGFVGVGEGVARRGGGVGELGEEHADDMAPRGEGAGLFVDAVLLGEAGGEVGRDQLAKLGEDGQLLPSWFVISHQGDPEWDRPPTTLENHGLWDGCVLYYERSEASF